MAAARLWWTLRWVGHPDVSVLDGGVAAWEGAGQPLQQGEVGVEPGDLTVRPGGMPVLDADGAADVARTGVLLDARTPVRYRGESEPIDPVAGHIPGAVNVPYADLVDGTGRLLPPQRLRAVLPAGPVVGAYCGSGVTAAHTVLALEVAGLAPASLYVGSWSDWVSIHPDRWLSGTSDERQTMTTTVVWSEELLGYDLGDHPLDPVRVELTIALARSLGVLDRPGVRVVAPTHGGRRRHRRACTTSGTSGRSRPRRRSSTSDRFGLGTGDNPVFDHMHEASALVAGATIAAAEAVWRGRPCARSTSPAGCTTRCPTGPRGSASTTTPPSPSRGYSTWAPSGSPMSISMYITETGCRRSSGTIHGC